MFCRGQHVVAGSSLNNLTKTPEPASIGGTAGPVAGRSPLAPGVGARRVRLRATASWCGGKAAKPRPAKPASIIAHVEGSGTLLPVKENAALNGLWWVMSVPMGEGEHPRIFVD